MTWDLINACAILNVPLSGNLETWNITCMMSTQGVISLEWVLSLSRA